MAIDWSLGVMPDVAGNALAAFQQGQDRRMAHDMRREQMDMQRQQFAAQQAEREAAAKTAQQEQVVIMGKLLAQAQDPASYQQALAAAQQYGLDVSKAPQQFDPNWVAQQRMIVDAFTKDKGQTISGLAREFQDAGVDINSPQGQEMFRAALASKYSTESVADNGDTVRRPAFNVNGDRAPNIPAGAIAELKSNPGTADKFDEIFGQGAAARILGGPSQPATGGFQN